MAEPDLSGLIRYRRYQLDEKRRFIARLYAEADKIYGTKKRALDEVAHERAYVVESSDPHVITGFLTYQGMMKKKVALIDKEIQRIDTRIQVAQDDLREEYAEIKKYEIVQRRRLERKRAELARREAALFDAQALEMYRRAVENA
ncbi:MAG: hypothetical protein H6865_05635 [Rhodospirillales bacterium]|nr:hypothetical protein [Alphaproteobacteria bacterium]MCB9987102.1 hypothetical protein [Rhodospirillales bacterium]USO08139.1 MAG: hypothetical protein H6866_02660 [Rhodospirillales bacterium]